MEKGRLRAAFLLPSFQHGHAIATGKAGECPRAKAPVISSLMGRATNSWRRVAYARSSPTPLSPPWEKRVAGTRRERMVIRRTARCGEARGEGARIERARRIRAQPCSLATFRCCMAPSVNVVWMVEPLTSALCPGYRQAGVSDDD